MPNPVNAQPESTAAQIVGELLGGGEAVDEGVFTLDPAAAAAKLAAFSYADPDEWLIPTVEGLIGLGATAITIRKRFNRLRVRAVGASVGQADLATLYTHAIGRGVDDHARALGRLAIGIDMLLCGSPQTRVRLRGPETSTTELRWRTAPNVSTRTEPRGDAVELAVEQPWLASPIALERARSLLATAVRFCPVEIQLDGASISNRPRDSYDLVHGEGPGYRFSAGFRTSGEEPTVIEFGVHGVCTERITGHGLAFRGVIELDAPRRDLSQMKLVRDGAINQAFAEVEQARHAALARLRRAAAEWTDATRPPEWPAERVDLVLDRPVRELPEDRRRVVIRQVREDERRQWARYLAHSAAAGLSGMAGLFAAVLVAVGAWMWTEEFETAGGTLLMLGLPLIAAAVLLRQRDARSIEETLRVQDYGIRTHATVDRVKLAHGPNGPMPIATVYWSFVDIAGVKQTGTSLPRIEPPHPQAGDRIVIYYDPERPGHSLWEVDAGARPS